LPPSRESLSYTRIGLLIREIDDRFLGGAGDLCVGACTTVEGIVAAHAVLGVDSVIAVLPEEAVGPAASDDRVVARTPALVVVAAPAAYRVVCLRAGQGVVLGEPTRLSTPVKVSEPSPVAVLVAQIVGFS
jgi:hypothetical protein